MRYYLAPPPNGPLSRIVAAVFAVLTLVGAFFFGMIVLALAVGLGLLAWLGVTLMMWWSRRQGERRTDSSRRAGSPGQGVHEARGGDIIDADYEVISQRDDD